MADISSLMPRIESLSSLEIPIRGSHSLYNISCPSYTWRGGKKKSSDSSTLLSFKSTLAPFSSFSLSRPSIALSSRASSLSYQLKQEQDPQDSATEDEAATHVSSKDMLREAILKFSEEEVDVAARKYNLEEELFSEIDFAQINAFTDRPFSGNPAAVCYLPMEKDDQWLQYIAREFNLSETAFLIKRGSNIKKPSVQKKEVGELNDDEIPDEFNLRWFTPKVEATLCGHATLASAHLLFSSGIAEGETILFHTKSGILKARKVSGYDDEGEQNEGGAQEEFTTRKKRCPVGVGVVELDFPLFVATKCDDKELKTVSEALGGVKSLWAGRSSIGDYLVEVSSTKELEQLRPDISKMMDAPGRGGFIVTARAEGDTEVDFVSRFFCPKGGILEDPVTGSAHCTLGPYWADKLGKRTLKAFQASERGGHLTVRVDKGEGRAYLQGSAVLVMAGVLLNTMHAQA